jgi:NADH-quinone oxidoreductase subunit E
VSLTASPPAFSADQLAEVRRLQALYPDRRGALLPVLHMAQETFGHISLDVETYVAGLFGLSAAHVHEVVTFYTLFFQEPKGRHIVAVCHNLSCHLAGAPELLAHLKTRLGIAPGETTDDGRITFQAVECLCACEAAPMAQVDDRYELNLTPEKLDRILEGLR